MEEIKWKNYAFENKYTIIVIHISNFIEYF